MNMASFDTSDNETFALSLSKGRSYPALRQAQGERCLIHNMFHVSR